jgi:acyl-coenzyme A synthetase/AMP-(fatty) acid ligase
MPGNNGGVTADYITFHAAERPDAVAIVNNGRSITYAEFARHLRRFTHALRALDLPPGARAVISCDDAYFNWLIRLGFEQLRVVTATMDLPDRDTGPKFMRDFDIVLSAKSSSASAVRHHAITTEWLESVLESGEEDRGPAPERRPEDPVRIVLTSGTTGAPKRLLYTRHIHEAHIARVTWFGDLTRRSRYLLALRIAVSGPAACIRVGGTVVLERRMGLAEAITAHGITHTTLPPLGLKQLLDELPSDFARPQDLMIWSFGAPISTALREKALARLASDICDIYASNEADSISSIRGRPAAEIGCIFPGVRVEVVDEHDRPLPFGQAGRIRVRTDCMVTGYMDLPAAERRIFRDGWFYAGDIGILHDAHRLQVLGRSDDILNIGWRKIAPEMIEERILRLGDVADVGVCAVPNRDGIEELCIAITGQRSSDAVLLQRITDALRDLQLGRFHVIKLPTIPRTAIGKLQRKMLKEIAATVHARPSAGVE